MYASHGFLRSDIGDVDVVYDNGAYHLFHLVLPNHDFIAHAVSDDGMTWRRVKNALFVGDPGAWDDDMLWTMAVSLNPYAGNGDPSQKKWRMFYTGLSRAEHGRVQRLGLAHSDDLMSWEKVTGRGYPIEAPGRYYESSVEEGRHWVSFRDPFFCDIDGDKRLLVSARVKDGPLVRRGCVAQVREHAPDQFEPMPPLYQPRLYDDVEVPGVFKLDGRYFLIGSIREDVKVHYWVADSFEGPYGNYFDNVLLPKGNYAGRVCQTPDGPVLFNFFTRHEADGGRSNMLPPPKRLVTDSTGRLRLKSTRTIDGLVTDTLPKCAVKDWRPLLGNPGAVVEDHDGSPAYLCASAYEAFVMPGQVSDFRAHGRLSLEGIGKCGMVFRVDDEGNGYYLSLDLIKGVAQIRAWGVRDSGEFESAFNYQALQAGYFVSDRDGDWEIELVAMGPYLECSINGYVILTLADDRYAQGGLGFYVESAAIRVEDWRVEVLTAPANELEPAPMLPIDHETAPPSPLDEA